MPDSQRIQIRQAIVGHTEVMRALLTESASHARKYLLFTNGGGAAVLLAFMGSNPAIRVALSARAALALFVIGIIAVGVLSASDYQHQRRGLLRWVSESDRFFRNQIDGEDLYGALNFASKYGDLLTRVAGYAAFGCFILGSLVAIGGFLAS